LFYNQVTRFKLAMCLSAPLSLHGHISESSESDLLLRKSIRKQSIKSIMSTSMPCLCCRFWEDWHWQAPVISCVEIFMKLLYKEN